MNDNIILKLQHFFVVDTKIKKEMNSMCPPTDNEYLDNDSIIKYLDNTYESIIYIFSELKCITNDLFGIDSPLMKKIEILEKVLKEEFINCNTNITKLRIIYKTLISDMDSKFIDIVKKECVGYTSLDITQSLSNAKTINEILHLIHSYVLNNDNILANIPLIEQKKNENQYPISLRGIINPLFIELFKQFPINLDCGWTEMVGINDNKLLMMVRDRGHALSIEISIIGNIARIEYFIPKICNINMVNNLPGINKVNENSLGASGVIEVDKSILSFTLFDFISKVPMDSDIIHNFDENYHRMSF